jgi:hypothetical protein
VRKSYRFLGFKLGSSVAARSAEFFSFQCQVKYIVATTPIPPSVRNHPQKMSWRKFFFTEIKLKMFPSFTSCKIKPQKTSWRIFLPKKIKIFLSFYSGKIKPCKMRWRILLRTKIKKILSFSSCKIKPFLIHDFDVNPSYFPSSFLTVWVHKWTVSMLKPTAY